MASDFSIAFVGRMKHGAIVEGLHRVGWTQSDLGRALGVDASKIGRIVNMQEAPSRDWLTPERERVLFDLTGMLPDELWPEWSREADWLAGEKRVCIVREIPVANLICGSTCGLLDQPEDQYTTSLRGEMTASLQRALKTLNPNEIKVIRLRFGIDDDRERTLDDVAGQMGLSRDRIRGIEAGALRKLRHPARSKKLRPFIEPSWHRRDEQR